MARTVAVVVAVVVRRRVGMDGLVRGGEVGDWRDEDGCCRCISFFGGYRCCVG